MSSLESLKHVGITQEEISLIVLHVLRLCSATITYNGNAKGNKDDTENCNDYILKFDNVGKLYKMDDNGIASPIYRQGFGNHVDDTDNLIHKNDLNESFALPSPARESLLSFLIQILTKDGYLRSVSNQSFTVQDDKEYSGEKNDSLLLVIHWKALLRMLLRTTPYLDENECGKPHSDSLSRQSNVLKRTVSIIKYSRRFFDQGLEIKQNILSDKTAREVWEMVKPDLMNRSHSNACYRAMMLLYMFHPTRCSSEFYIEVMPSWNESWNSIDRCPEFDFLWICMFCRARKFVDPGTYDWGSLRKRLLTLCGYWLQIPVGGTSSDKSFPCAAEAKSRYIPSRLKTFIKDDSALQEGVDFVAKLTKLLIFCCGKNDGMEGVGAEGNDTINDAPPVSHGTEDLLRFFSFVGPYFNPSNTGSWTFPLGVMLHYMSHELCRRIGRDCSQKTVNGSLPHLAKTLSEVEPFKRNPGIPDNEIVLILDSILPLCQQALYSKSPHVSRAGEASLLYLSHIDYKICAPLLDFAMRALDVSSVTQSHQAPAALSTINRLILPSLRRNPLILLERLPDILRLSLAGIDSNDEEKTMRTLVLYRTLTSWLPVGHTDKLMDSISFGKECKQTKWLFWGENEMDLINYDCDSKNYWDSLRRLPPNSIMFQPDFSQPFDAKNEELYLTTINLAEEASHAMADWSLSFLDRIYGLFRAAGEQEKVGKSHRVATKRSSAADVSQARHFARILKECLRQFFASMDEVTFQSALTSVQGFLMEETHSLAVKYASALCESICSARADAKKNKNCSPGLGHLTLSLTSNMNEWSRDAILYRVRCLGGAVRKAGSEVIIYRQQLLSTLEFTLNHQNKHIFKAGCKLLRHMLSSQSEYYPLCSDSCPRTGSTIRVGESAQLKDDKILWHVPSGTQIDFVAELLSKFVYTRIRNLTAQSQSDLVFVEKNIDIDNEAKLTSKHDYLAEWRNCLRILRYAIRGCPGLLVEMTIKQDKENRKAFDLDPNEKASNALIQLSSPSTQSIIISSRERISRLIISLLSLIVKESSTMDSATINMAGSPRNSNKTTMIASDIKICKEVSAISQLLFARRSASFRSEDAFTIWKAQKDFCYDRVIHNQRKEISVILQKVGFSNSAITKTYSDGENGGKSLPRRMVSNRVEIFLHSCQRSASFEVPRRMRRERGVESIATLNKLSPNIDLEQFHSEVHNAMEVNVDLIASEKFFALDKYESILDGIFALACHHNSSIRGYGIRAVEYGFSRFGWLAVERAPRLISALSLDDDEHEHEFGVLSCSRLSRKDESHTRKRLSEVLKGVCMITVVPRMIKQIISSYELRVKLLNALCGTQHVISLLPAEEMTKLLSYFHQIFSSFRSHFFTMPNLTDKNEILHERCISQLSVLLREDKNEDTDESSSLNWRNRLLVCWFMTTLADKNLFLSKQKEIVNMMWETCILLIQKESGQPLQKVALGLFGRLAYISQLITHQSTLLLQNKMAEEGFCRCFCNALVYNHKEDQSVGGGHGAQWSIGVSEIIRDSTSNLAPKIIFPFLKTGRSSTHLKISHAQLIHIILTNMEADAVGKTVNHLLLVAEELAASPPSEDQRNQLCASAEIFSGAFIGMIQHQHNFDFIQATFNDIFAPFLDKTIELIPSSSLGAFIDAVRYSMSKMSLSICQLLLSWSITKIENSLWSYEDTDLTTGTDGFATQSKWLAIVNIILIEMEFQSDTMKHIPWSFALQSLQIYNDTQSQHDLEEHNILETAWAAVCNRLLPRLLVALGHPYQSCRERIASVLFRIAYCYRNQNSFQSDVNESSNPSSLIISKLLDLDDSSDKSSKSHQHSLITLRLFLSHCIHHGENQKEFTMYIIPLLPLAFESIKPSIDEDEAKEDDPEIRMLQAQVVQAYRYTISEISVSCKVAYWSSTDISRVLQSLDTVSKHSTWQLRLAVAHFLRCFQGNHKFLFSPKQSNKTTKIVARLLADERREVSAAAMAALTGILAATPLSTVTSMVQKYVKKANNSVIKKAKKKRMSKESPEEQSKEEQDAALDKEKERAIKQQTSVYFLCASILATPYETPAYAPPALAALSKHSYEHSAPLAIRETVKMCCGEYKRTHVSDNWEVHRKQFTQDQLEALEDVVSTPHYYA